jgi:hypothetical protein
MEFIDGRIRTDPEVAEKISKNAPKNTDAWDFGTIEGVIACTEGLFVVNYYALKPTSLEETHPNPPMMPEGHPNIKRGPWPSGPSKKY